MNCHSLEQAIVEVARERDVGRGTAAAVEAHAEHCPSCASRLAREQQLSRALRALAEATAAEAPHALLERRLMDAFAEQQAVRAGRWRPAAVAAAIAALGVIAWWQLPGALPRGTRESEVASAGAARPSATKTPLETAKAHGAGTDASRSPSPSPSAAKPHRPGRRGAISKPVTAGAGFMALPAALGLPDFESGEIVRMELPIAALPAYGIEIVSDSRASVEADLLIGQDGKARAIRLVRATTRSGAEQ